MSRTIEKPAYDPYYTSKPRRTDPASSSSAGQVSMIKLISHISTYDRAVQRIAELKTWLQMVHTF